MGDTKAEVKKEVQNFIDNVLTDETESVQDFFVKLIQPEDEEQHWLDVGLKYTIEKLLSQLISLDVNTEDAQHLEQLKKGEVKGVILG